MSVSPLSLSDEIKVHPIAEMFPMMSGEELDELAADIKANGLLNPIIKDSDGSIIDGRNRWEACRRAGIVPTFETFKGKDPIAFIVSNNITRRHLTKAQRAMYAAKAKNGLVPREPLSFIGSRGTIREFEEHLKVSHTGIAKALVILEFAPDLESLVTGGAMSLNEAYATAQARQVDANSDEAKMVKLDKAYPDLAQAVEEEKITLNKALEEMEIRDAKYVSNCRSVARTLEGILTFTGAISQSEPDEMVDEISHFINPEHFTPALRESTKEQFKRAIKVLNEIAKDWNKYEQKPTFQTVSDN
jgi:ParB-like nuclease family protein